MSSEYDVRGEPPRAETIGSTTEPAEARSLSSVGDLLSNISRDFSTLMQQEVALAKAEVSQSAKDAGKGAGMLGAAGIAGHFVLLFLSLALWWALGDWVGLGWSAVIVAVVWAVIAAILASMGRSEMKKVSGMPRTVETTKQIPDALKGNESA